MYRNCTATRSLQTPTSSLYIITWLSHWREGLQPTPTFAFFLCTHLQKGSWVQWGQGSLVAEYIEKRGWFPGQSGSQTYGHEGVVTLRQVLGYTGALALVPTPTAG